MKTKINLIPREFYQKGSRFVSLPQADWKLILKIIIPIIALKLIMVVFTIKLKADINKIQDDIKSYTQKISSLEISVKTDLKTKQEKIDNIKLAIAEKEKELNNFGSIAIPSLRKEKFIYDLLKLVAKSIPDDVWLDEITFDRETADFSLKGFSFSHPKIGAFLAKLNQSPHLKNLYMKYSEINPNETIKQNIIKFEANGKLNF